MIKWILTGIAVLVLPVAPIPWPYACQIGSVATGKSTVRYYFRPAGILGAITIDNPWVYAEIDETVSRRVHVEGVWADTPCDGVERLSRAMNIPRPSCEDSIFAL